MIGKHKVQTPLIIFTMVRMLALACQDINISPLGTLLKFIV
jgi:hypothetical protein